MRRVYMDNNATTPMLPEVFRAMEPWFLQSFGNASSIHLHGQAARAAVEGAREDVAELIGARASEVVFTGGATESDNLALFGSFGADAAGGHLVTTAIEHHAVLHAAEELERRGVAVSYVAPSAEGVVSAEDVRRAIRPETRLVSVMMANNETGALEPIAEIAKITREAGVRLHVDAVQAAGKVPIDVRALGCDLLTLSAHKMHGPQGVGALWVRRGVRLTPLFFGGAHERQRRAGTENVAGLVGFGRAAQVARAALADGTVERMAELRDRLEQGLLERVDACGVNGAPRSAAGDGRGTPVARTPNTTNLWFDHLEGEALVIALDLKGLAVSGGSACASGATEPSHVLTAMGVGEHRARASLRFSLSRLTTEADVEFALELVPAAVARLRELSPVYVKAEAAV